MTRDASATTGVVARTARALVEQARDRNERRLLVLHGAPSSTRDAAAVALDAAGVAPRDTVVVADARRDAVPGRHVATERARELLGTTQTAVVVDAHDALDPDVVGRTVGTVDGGGLYILLAPPLDAWPDRRDGFDERLAVPPFDVGDVRGAFRSRFVATLRERPGIAIVDVDGGTVEADGLVDPSPDRSQAAPVEVPADAGFPASAYERCRTADQADVLHALERLRDPDVAVVVEADRGRGKSSAAGLAAGGLAYEGDDVAVLAPARGNASEVFARAAEVLDDLDARADDGDGTVVASSGGRVRYVAPTAIEDGLGTPDAVVVDEAAALPVRWLERVLDVGVGVAYATTVHGYEGTGRGFDVRFRARLDASDRQVLDRTIGTPIRYAADDPVEAWAFDALLLDAAPAPADAVGPATPKEATYRTFEADALLADEDRLRGIFGLLVLAHYRTEPRDLVRLLDAPNLEVHALTVDDRVVSVALVAREGGWPASLRRSVYEGDRVPGNMIPDVLTSQLRDEGAGGPVGWRVMRIATHEAVRSRGLGSRLLDEIRDEADVDWLGVGYGVTPDLVRFWRDNGYRTVHLASRRNARSGEHSVVMLAPVTEAGRRLADRSTDWFLDRIASVLSDALVDADPGVVRAVLAATEGPVPLDLSERAWRLVASAAYGPGIYDVAPHPFRRLALKELIEGEAGLDAEAERLLVRKVLQARPWEDVVAELGYPSTRMAMRALGAAYRPIVDAYGTRVARDETARHG